jgi:hypothetical protein
VIEKERMREEVDRMIEQQRADDEIHDEAALERGRIEREQQMLRKRRMAECMNEIDAMNEEREVEQEVRASYVSSRLEQFGRILESQPYMSEWREMIRGAKYGEDRMSYYDFHQFIRKGADDAVAKNELTAIEANALVTQVLKQYVKM